MIAIPFFILGFVALCVLAVIAESLIKIGKCMSHIEDWLGEQTQLLRRNNGR